MGNTFLYSSKDEEKDKSAMTRKSLKPILFPNSKRNKCIGIGSTSNQNFNEKMMLGFDRTEENEDQI